MTAIIASLVVACASAASPTPPATTSPSITSSQASLAPSPSSTSPSPSQTASPPVAEAPPPLRWVRIGDGDEIDPVGHLIAFDNGYVAFWGESPWISYSPDGQVWLRSDLATPCPGQSVFADREVFGGASNGELIVLVGSEHVQDAQICGTTQAAAWVSTDGVSWERAQGFGAQGSGIVYLENVWATPEGWEAPLEGADGTVTIWRSGNGLRWEPVAVVGLGDAGSGPAAAAPGGVRLLVVHDRDAETSRLVSSRDGLDWRDIAGPPPGAGSISKLLAPTQTFPDWVAATVDDAAGRSMIWTSTDLEHWRGAPFPMPQVKQLAHTAYGLLALGDDPCQYTGSSCDSVPRKYLISTDGAKWSSVDGASDAEIFVEGPAGVIGIGPNVWRLEPYPDAEASLISGLRPDVRFACAARIADLPPRAVAGVECSPDIDLIERVGVYRFTSQDDLLKTYYERLADYGVEPNSGSCADARAGENAYVPGDGPYRAGCYRNEFGNANYRFTVPDALVYVGVLGTGKDLEALRDLAWLGNEDTPGSPTIWRGTGR